MGVLFLCVFEKGLDFFLKPFFWKIFFFNLCGGEIMSNFPIHEEGGLFNGVIKPVLKGSPVHKRAIFLHIS